MSEAWTRLPASRGEFENVRLCSEEIAEFCYRPVKCKKDYRMVVLRKNLSREKGEQVLFPEIRYFFYITNDPKMSARRVVFHANDRCNQENLIEQLKNGVNALRVPVYDLLSNWAYMVVASLAWTLKAWFALTLPKQEDMEKVQRMEFKTFLNSCMLVPCQVKRKARGTVITALAYTEGVRWLIDSREAVKRLTLE